MALRRLRWRKQAESLPNEVRRRRQAVVRFVYFGSILVLATWLGNLFLGGLFFLRSEGQIMGVPATVAAEYGATVRSVSVHVGQHVSVGQVIAVISSQSVAENLAQLSSQQADRALRLSDLRIRSDTVNAVIGLAQMRESLATQTRGKLNTLLAGGWLSNDMRTAALDSEFRSRVDLAQLTAEQGAISAQIAGLAKAVAAADDAMVQLRTLYDGGVVRAPINGIVGRRMIENGTVLLPGQTLMELYQDDRFVSAYLPTGSLFSVSEGDPIVASTGLQTFTGTITRIEPVAAALPGEFQHAFTTVERQQIMRIALDPGQTPPPLFTKVSVRSPWSWPWSHDHGSVPQK